MSKIMLNINALPLIRQLGWRLSEKNYQHKFSGQVHPINYIKAELGYSHEILSRFYLF